MQRRWCFSSNWNRRSGTQFENYTKLLNTLGLVHQTAPDKTFRIKTYPYEYICQC